MDFYLFSSFLILYFPSTFPKDGGGVLIVFFRYNLGSLGTQIDEDEKFHQPDILDPVLLLWFVFLEYWLSLNSVGLLLVWWHLLFHDLLHVSFRRNLVHFLSSRSSIHDDCLSHHTF